MNIEHILLKEIRNAFLSQFSADINIEDLSLQPTRKEFEGSFTFVTFPYSRLSKKNPEETGRLIGEFLKNNTSVVDDYNVIKGFLNLSISKKIWVKLFENLWEAPDYGNQKPNGQKVIIEYSSPNTNKPLHLGHLRNNFLGYSVAEILKAAGYEVKKVNLVNDRGIHICKSMLAYQMYGKGATPQSSGKKGDHLVGKYYVKFDKIYKKEIAELVQQGLSEDVAKKMAPIIKKAQEMLKKWEQGDPEVVELWKKLNGWVYEGFQQTYDQMGVDFDTYLYESNTYLLGKNIVEEGLEKGIFFKKENNSVWVDLSDEGLDQKLLLRSDGTSVYMTQDLGTADYKYNDYPFDKSIYVVGNEQDYHFQVLFKILKKLGRKYRSGMYHLSYGMVDLPSGKMKSREGTVVDADDLMQEMIDTAEQHTKELGKIEGFSEEQAKELFETLGIGALKYFLLKVDPKKRMLFNPQESIEFQGHTGPFIQYTHARIKSILRKAEQIGIALDVEALQNLPSLHETEAEIIQLLGDFSNKLQLAAEEYSPAVITQFCYDLAKAYNRFYAEVSIFNEENEYALKFRVMLSKIVADHLRFSMKLLGIRVPDRM
ncbi:arginine--tRNA ligase [soil metagenome]